MFEYEDKKKLFDKYRADPRTLYDKLIALSKDRGATPNERAVAAEKAEQLKRKEQRGDHTPSGDAVNEFIRKHVNPDQPNAGWFYKPEQRMRRAHLKPRSQRVQKSFYTHLMREAQERAKYRDKYYDEFMGLKDHPKAEEARQKIIDMMGMPNIERHICIINGKLTKLFLFWHYGVSRNITWFFIERDTMSHKTKRSKRYFTRDAAMEAFNSESITWQQFEVI